MASFAQRVAEAIFNAAQSGSAVWDELNGPSARLLKVSDTKYLVVIPREYDDDGEPTSLACVVTVQLS